MKTFAEVLFESGVSRNGKGVALVDENGSRAVSWDELHAMAQAVARFALRENMSGVVPVCMDRSAECAATLLGLNLAGVGVAPVAAGAPKARLQSISEQTGNEVWTQERFEQAKAFTQDSAPIERASDKCCDEAAYVVFTSGSTGKPKGVVLSNDCVIRSMRRTAGAEYYDYQPGEHALQSVSFAFVALIADLFAPLYAGCTVHILPDEARKDPALLTRYLRDHDINATFVPPQVLARLGDAPSLRIVCTGSDRVSNLGPKGYRLVNIYGMSEAACFISSFDVQEPMETTPIGMPFSDFKGYIVNERGELAEEGELCLSGALSSGYLGMPEQTAAAFTPNPFCDEPGHEVLFHTGDVVRRRDETSLYFLGRKDFMLKINGQRVEPGEVEAALLSIEGIENAAVKGFTRQDGRNFLCAYYVTQQQIEPEALHALLGEMLPDYLVPSYVVRLDELPLNENGKIAYKALEPPAASATKRSHEPASTPEEAALCRAFEEALERGGRSIDRVGATDDFFELGGDSICAMDAVRAAHIEGLRVTDVFAGKTPRGIAGRLELRGAHRSPASASEVSVEHDAVAPGHDADASSKGVAPNRVPLTDSQMGIYLACAARPDEALYNIPFVLHVPCTQPLEGGSVKAAIDSVLAAHPALLSHVEQDEEGAYMVRGALPQSGICTAEEAGEDGVEGAYAAFVQAFDLQAGPLVRAHALLLSNELQVLVDTHHIVSDGTSVALLCRQIASALTGAPVEAEAVDAFELQGREACCAAGDAQAATDEYFAGLLAGEEMDSNLIPDRMEGVAAEGACGSFKVSLDVPDLKPLLSSKGITENSFFLGVFGYALAKMTGATGSLFAAAERGRAEADLDGTVSMLVRTLPVCLHIDEADTPARFLESTQGQFFATIEHNSASFGELCREYGISSDVMFVYQDALFDGFETPFGRASIDFLPARASIANLSTSVNKRCGVPADEAARAGRGGCYSVAFEYRADRYLADTIKRFARLFETVAEAFFQCLADEKLADAPLRSIGLVSDADREFLDDLNDNARSYDMAATIIDAFRASVARRPDAPAVAFGGATYSYAQADEVSDRIAAELMRCGIVRGDVVPILIPRCEYMVLAALGVMKIGAMYQPLDPSYPPERLAFMCEDSAARLLIADRELAALVPGFSGTVLYVDSIPSLPEAGSDGARAIIEQAPRAADPMVLLYTSGTTGQPKGCMVSHGNLMALLGCYIDIVGMGEDSAVMAYASYGFDAHMTDMYPALACGARIRIVPEELRLDLPGLKELCDSDKITHLLMTTQLGRQFAIDYPQADTLKVLLVGGETLVPFTPECGYRLINAYGPSECTVMISTFTVDRFYDNIPIGLALPNTKFYVIDAAGRRVPVGVPGELVACGPQVAMGYLNREEKTREVFVANSYEQAPVAGDIALGQPVSAEQPPSPYDRCYRTGDIVRILGDGNVEFIGRRDMQVKVRGFRIELSEVEQVIGEYPGVDAAVAVARKDASGTCIHAYVVGKEPIDIEGLKRFILERKPPYMVPAATMQIDAIPYTPNMKVDKRKLPIIELVSHGGADEGVRKLTALEKKLVELLEESCGVQGIGVQDDFSLAGLTSITSIKLSVKLYKEYGVKFNSKDLLNGMNVLALEDAIVSSLLTGARASDEAAVDAQSSSKEMWSSYPLTQTQMGIYLDSLRAGSEAYNIPLLLKLPSDIDVPRLKRAVVEAVKAHPSLLCFIHATEGGDVAIFPQLDMPIVVEEETRGADDMPIEYTSFDFSEKPLFRLRVIRSGSEAYLFIEAHHIVFDGESGAILLADIDRAYQGEHLEGEAYTAFDLALEERDARTEAALAQAKGAYASVFQGVSADYLPCADRHGEVSVRRGGCAIGLSHNRVAACCESHGITENVFFTGVFALTLARFTAHEDALFATVHNGRTDPRTAELVSMLVKTLPLFVQAEASSSVGDYLRAIADRMRLLKQNDVYSFADAVRDFELNANVIFVYQGKMGSVGTLGGQALELVETAVESPKAELSCEVFEEGEGYRVSVECNGGRYSDDMVATFADAFATCAASLLDADEVGQVDICSAAALARFDSFNDTAWDVPYRPSYRLLEDSAQAHPDRLAVVAGEERLTYRQLDCMANRLARNLLDAGVESGSVVEVIAPRCAGVYVAQNGILKAGSAFLFLSPEYPDERIAFVSGDAQAAAIVTTQAIAQERAALFEKIGCPLLLIDDVPADAADASPALDVGPDEPAYLIYTSGTTGKPKGIVVRQRGLANLVDLNPANEQIACYTQDSPVIAAVAAFTFDASIFEEFIALAHAMTILIAGDEEIHNPMAFTKLCLQHGVTTITATASFYLSCLDYPGFAEAAAQLKCIVQGGEAFPPVLYEEFRRVNPSLRIVNSYGPSETTVSCSAKVLDSPENITIGTPVSNTLIYMIDKQGHILPMGALGEMVVLGEGVGLGYLNRPELTARTFVQMQGMPAYRTGDLAIVTHAGEIEFHGRADDQVKLRGLRVELGEVEHAIAECEDVTRAVVTVHGDERNRFLAAYFTAKRHIAPDDIVAQISRTLAAYMVPRIFIQLDAMPMTANGKVDKRALPEPKMEMQDREYVEPAGELERTFCEAFADILGVERVGATDDFFSLGGTSLTASKLAMFALSHNIDIVYADIFEHPSPRELAALAGEQNAEPQSGSTDDAKASGQMQPKPASPVSEEQADAMQQGRSGFAGSEFIVIPRALEGNAARFDDDPGHRPLGAVLLTGATGYLGMHILKRLIDEGSDDIYCLMRKGAFDTLEMRLQSLFVYYFEESLEDLLGRRIHCVEGDITDAGLVSGLDTVPFDTLINCAACVKHFSNDDTLEQVNVRGVENLVELCLATGARLVHVSTVSVAGEATADSPASNHILHENELYFGQILENRYLATKFESECVVLSAVARGLDAKIMRVGNLMPRRSDGEFQINSITNGFMRQLRGYHALGCVPYSALAGEFEFSPIDETAAAILVLAQTASRFTVFHANNTHRVFLADVVRTMNAAGLPVEAVDGATFSDRLQTALADTQANEVVAGLIAYLGRNQTQRPLGYDNSFTRIVLNRLGFYWHISDDAYMKTALEALEGLGFFDADLQ